MPLDAQGRYKAPAGTRAAPNTVIESGKYNAFIDDLETTMDAQVDAAGKKPFTTAINAGNNKITALANGTAATDAATFGQLQSTAQTGTLAQATTVGGTADAITLVFSPVQTAYTANQRFRWRASGANTIAAPTVNIDGLGNRTIVKLSGLPLVPGDIPGAGFIAEAVFNGTNVVLLNPAVIPDNEFVAISVSGTVNAIAITITPAITVYTAGLKVRFTSAGTNTVANPTLSVSGLVGRAIKKADGTDYSIGEFPAIGQSVLLTYDGTNFVMGETLAGRILSTAASLTAQKTLLGAGLWLGTAVNSTSGTTIDFTGIPAGVNRVTLMFSGVSTNSVSPILIQLGTASAFETTGYQGSQAALGNAAQFASFMPTNGFYDGWGSAANLRNGTFRFHRLTGNQWVLEGVSALQSQDAYVSTFAGSKTLAAELTRIRITTIAGTGVFDAGLINIAWEF